MNQEERSTIFGQLDPRSKLMLCALGCGGVMNVMLSNGCTLHQVLNISSPDTDPRHVVLKEHSTMGYVYTVHIFDVVAVGEKV